MNYYTLKQTNDLPGILLPHYPSASAIWSEHKPLIIKGSTDGRNTSCRFLPFYEATVLSKSFLISAEAWLVWDELQDISRNRPCVFGCFQTHEFKPCRLVMPRVLEALHEDTVYLKDGNIKSISLCKSRIGTNQIFTVKGAACYYLIVSEYVLEEMLRKNITGFTYEPVAMGGE